MRVWGLAGPVMALVMAGLAEPALARQTAPQFPRIEQVPIRVDIEFYDVHGRTSRALEDSLRYNGPIGYDAEARYGLSWYWRYEQAGERCHITVLELPVEVTIRYPRWVDHDQARRQLRDHWQRRLVVLEAHENGHAILAVAAAITLYNELVTFGQDVECGSIEAEFEARWDEAVAALRERQREYDRITEHGIRQNDYDWTPITGPRSSP